MGQAVSGAALGGAQRRAGLRPGEQVLVAADPGLDVLMVPPLAALDSMIVAFHAALVEGDHDDQPVP